MANQDRKYTNIASSSAPIKALRAGTYQGDYNFPPVGFDNIYNMILNRIGQSEDYNAFMATGAELGNLGQWTYRATPIGQIISTSKSPKNQQNVAGLEKVVNSLFPEFPKWLEDLETAQSNATVLYNVAGGKTGADRLKDEEYLPYAQAAIPELNKYIWTTIDNVTNAVVEAGKKQFDDKIFEVRLDRFGNPEASGTLDALDTQFRNSGNYNPKQTGLDNWYKNLSTPIVQEARGQIQPKEHNVTQYNDLAGYLQEKYFPYNKLKYDWYEPETWFPMAVKTILGTALGGSIAGLSSGTWGGASGAGAGGGAGGGGATGGTGASAGGWAEAMAPYTGMTGATSASTTAAPWWSTLGSTLGTAGTQGGNMAGLDWATLTGQDSGLDLTNIFSNIYSPGGLPPTGWGGGGGGWMDWLVNLGKGATGTGGEGGWGTAGKVLGKVLGRLGGGGGGQQPTGGQGGTGIDWLDSLLNIILGKEGGGGGLLGLGTTAAAGYLSGEQQEDYQNWIERLYQPQQDYQKAQLGLFEDVFAPSSRELGGYLSDELTKPFSLTPELEESIWGKAKERVGEAYKTQEQTASERFAGSGMLEQGPAQQYFNDLGLQKIKSLEDVAVEQSIWEYGQKYKEKQDKYSNLLSFVGRTPQVQSYGTPNYAGQMTDWSKLIELISPTPKLNLGI